MGPVISKDKKSKHSSKLAKESVTKNGPEEEEKVP